MAPMRPVTISQGTNRLTGNATQRIMTAYREVLADPPVSDSMPDLWDGHAAERIVRILTGAA